MVLSLAQTEHKYSRRPETRKIPWRYILLLLQDGILFKYLEDDFERFEGQCEDFRRILWHEVENSFDNVREERGENLRVSRWLQVITILKHSTHGRDTHACRLMGAHSHHCCFQKPKKYVVIAKIIFLRRDSVTSRTCEADLETWQMSSGSQSTNIDRAERERLKTFENMTKIYGNCRCCCFLPFSLRWLRTTFWRKRWRSKGHVPLAWSSTINFLMLPRLNMTASWIFHLLKWKHVTSDDSLSHDVILKVLLQTSAGCLQFLPFQHFAGAAEWRWRSLTWLLLGILFQETKTKPFL